MNIETLNWDTHLCNFFGVSKKLLPEIRSSSEVYGVFAKGLLKVKVALRKTSFNFVTREKKRSKFLNDEFLILREFHYPDV